MNAFEFYNPTKIIFGEGQIRQLSKEIPLRERVLVTFGGGSVKKNSVYDQVRSALKDHHIWEFWGIEPNPTYETLMKAVEMVKKEQISYLLAVGGGSVIDGTKFIASASLFEEGDPWRILSENAPVKRSLPLSTVLTLPATGSEMNSGSVVSRKSTQDKLFFVSPLNFPVFSILDPSTTYSLPEDQIANGVVDAFVHVMEQYLTYPTSSDVQDRFSEGLLMTLMDHGPRALKNKTDVSVRSNIMWAACLALNGLIGAGVPQDWTAHMIGHELTNRYEIPHGRTLAITLPAVMRVMWAQKKDKMLQYGHRVLNISNSLSEEDVIAQTIDRTKQFFHSLNVPTSLKAYGISDSGIELIGNDLKRHGMVALGEKGNVTLEISKEILKHCWIA